MGETIGIAIFIISIGGVNFTRNFINYQLVKRRAKADGKITKEEQKLINSARKVFFRSGLNTLSMAFKIKINRQAKPEDLINTVKKIKLTN